MNGQRFANVPNVMEYIKSLKAGTRPVIVDESDIDDRMTETIMLGLRTSRGIDRHQFAVRYGRSVEERLDQEQFALLVESGHLLHEGDSLKLSEEGIYLADEITRRLIK
jgi:oxygen-independent coproporphyrinogen-3 oxidase